MECRAHWGEGEKNKTGNVTWDQVRKAVCVEAIGIYSASNGVPQWRFYAGHRMEN